MAENWAFVLVMAKTVEKITHFSINSALKGLTKKINKNFFLAFLVKFSVFRPKNDNTHFYYFLVNPLRAGGEIISPRVPYTLKIQFTGT